MLRFVCEADCKWSCTPVNFNLLWGLRRRKKLVNLSWSWERCHGLRFQFPATIYALSCAICWMQLLRLKNLIYFWTFLCCDYDFQFKFNYSWFLNIIVSVQWKRLPVNNEPPPARAYHSMTCIGSRYLLIGGFDGKSTFGDLWWLVPQGTSLLRVYLSFYSVLVWQPFSMLEALLGWSF